MHDGLCTAAAAPTAPVDAKYIQLFAHGQPDSPHDTPNAAAALKLRFRSED